MKLIRGLNNLPVNWKKSVITIGAFDGLHLGHLALINECVALAKKHQSPSVLVTFEPYPKTYFSKDKDLPRLMSLRDKFLVSQDLDIDYLLVLRFDHAIASLSAAQFVESILLKKLGVVGMVEGGDFRFGCDRQGDYEFLTRYADYFELIRVNDLELEGERISSSRVRLALLNHELLLAEKLLGRPYAISGQIVRGDQRGGGLGYPTINVHVHQKKLPLSGIYVVYVEGLSKACWGVASVGYRPMYPSRRDLLEVFLLDFDETVYTQHCTVSFVNYLREELFFSSEQALIDQIALDVAQAREIIQTHFC